ncbi:MAG: aminodeoxychorismate synthase component I [Candidatus Omnitrophica bacterium]|nr:aminodeoxychorismate synthase component I [Candidatus Omnitrophota bacterium]
MEKTPLRLSLLDEDFLEERECFMLFETSLFDGENSKSYILFDPVDTIKVDRFSNVKRAFERIEEYSKGHFLAGYFSYELGYYFEKASFAPKDPSSRPLIHLCIFKNMMTFDHRTGMLSPRMPGLFTEEAGRRDFRVDNPRFNLTKHAYFRKISRIKKHIKNGDTYQVNLTGKYSFGFSGSAFSFYRDLKEKQNVPYGAFCKLGGGYLLSLSPELFFRRDGNTIYSRPMKGTIGRGANMKEDRSRISELKHNAKEVAGNLMIVDLIRNDLGKISKAGSVKVSSLFDVEKYNTLFQMTSTIKSVLRDDVTYFDIFRSLFPGGSVTGAPKIRTMQIIKDLEKADRKVYCGALGIIFPGNKAVFNLPIRTISISRGKGRVLSKAKGEMGVGGGITVDSDPEEEYRECVLKARFLTERHSPFSLIETMLWDGKFKFLDRHLGRMRDSAAYFGFVFDRAKITGKLKSARKAFKRGFQYRVRVLMPKDGEATIEASKIERNPGRSAAPVAVSGSRTDPGNLFLYHKTTNRGLYDAEYKRHRAKGYFDVIFLNTQDEVTEGAITNIVVKKNGRFYTPPLSSGLLPGVFRAYLIKTGRVKEKRIFLDDLRKADKVFLCNSVRGLVEVKLTSPCP